MADIISDALQLSSASSTGGPFIATVNIGSTNHGLTFLEFGSTVAGTIVSTAAPLPVVSTSAQALSTTGMGGSSNSPVFVRSDTNSTVNIAPLTTTSVIRIGNDTTQLVPVRLEASTVTQAVSLSTSSTVSVIASTGGAMPSPWATADYDSSAGTSEIRAAMGIVVPSTAGATVIGSTSGIPVVLSTTSTGHVLISSAGVGGSSGNPLYGRLDTNTVVMAQISGNATVSLAAGSTIAATISGNATVSLAAGSTIAASISTASVIRIGNDTTQLVPVRIEASTITQAVSFSTASTASVIISGGNSTVALAAGSTMTVSLTAGSTIAATISGNSTAIISTASKIEVLQAASSALNGVMRLWAGPVESTYSVNTITDTSAVSIYSSAASTRFNVTDLLAINAGGTEVVLSIYSASTAGSLLFRASVSTAAGGFGHVFATPRFSTAAGVAIVAQILPASTVYLNTGAFRST